MHWCFQETEALLMVLSALPLAGLWFRQLHAKWHARHHTDCEHKDHHAHEKKN